MNTILLNKHIKDFAQKLATNPVLQQDQFNERKERVAYYQSWTQERIDNMTGEDLYEYLGKLWAMLIWGNKQYKVDQLIADNTLDKIRTELGSLLYSNNGIEEKWNRFRKEIKGFGPAMISEILCHTFPEEYMLWNRKAFTGMNYLEVKHLPNHDYQLTGKKYAYLCSVCKIISEAMHQAAFQDHSLLAANYFIWEELQIEVTRPLQDNISVVAEPEAEYVNSDNKEAGVIAEFKHNDIRDKVAEIGTWLGFNASIEKKVGHGAVIDALWEASIGNLGRVMYAFEIQTGGSIDSLILNLMKASNNAAVQGLVAISDIKQINKIKKEVEHLPVLKDKLKYWDYAEVLQVHKQLEFSFGAINKLGLIPQGF